MSSLYQAVILDHAKNPRNHGALGHPTHTADAKNPTCGDAISMDLIVRNGTVDDIRFRGKGCAISQATASLLSEAVKGKSVGKALSLEAEDILSLLGVTLSPNRLKCALLSLEVLKKALADESENGL